MSEEVKGDPARGSGRTTRAMVGAPRGAIYVWCTGTVDWPTELARSCDRSDLSIRPLGWLRMSNVLGLNIPVVIDHAAWANMTQGGRDAAIYISARARLSAERSE